MTQCICHIPISDIKRMLGQSVVCLACTDDTWGDITGSGQFRAPRAGYYEFNVFRTIDNGSTEVFFLSLGESVTLPPDAYHVSYRRISNGTAAGKKVR